MALAHAMTLNFKYIDNKSKNTLVLLHGWGGSIASYDKFLVEATTAVKPQNALNYLLIDLPGFGKSPNPLSHWGTPEYANEIHTFLKNYTNQNLFLMGHSFGGALGITLASFYPNMFEKLILSAPSYRRRSAATNTEVDSNLSIRKKILRSRVFRSIRMIYYRIFYPTSDIYKHPNLENNFRRVVSYDLSPNASKIEIPTLLIWGTNDEHTPYEDALTLKELIKNSELMTIKDADHFTLKTYPAKVYERVLNFVFS